MAIRLSGMTSGLDTDSIGNGIVIYHQKREISEGAD